VISFLACFKFLILSLIRSCHKNLYSSTPGDEHNNSQYDVELCRKDNIQVTQGQTGTANGIPVYSVTIINTCNSGSCLNIHLSCGWFSSTRLINPAIFRRLGYNDCLVNNGKPLKPGQLLNFQYSNTFSYPLAVSS
ncbi:tpd1 protein -like 1, partial [Nicotiana attenuata]